MAADIVTSLTLTLLFLLLALRARSVEQPEGVLLQSRAAVLVAALPALLALRDRRLYVARRGALLALLTPLTW